MAINNYISRSSLWLFASFCLSFLVNTTLAATPASQTYVTSGEDGMDNSRNLTVALNIPRNETDSLYFHFSAPALQSWAAFGFGTRMKGALMFVVYEGENGRDVTVSPRVAEGNNEPQHNPNITIDLLEGSGVRDDTFIVNAKCTKCRTWSWGTIDTQTISQPMIWAIGAPVTLQSDSVEATIRRHTNYDFFKLNLKAATGAGGVPVPGSQADELDPTTSVGNGHEDQYGERRGPFTNGTIALHALLMIASFLIVFPAGYLFLRIFEKVWLHWGIQSLAAVLVIIGAGMGVVVSKRDQIYPSLNHPHQILGLTILGLVILTWSIGLFSHMIYRRTGVPAKTMIAHRILGPLTVSLGLINVCVGFNLANNRRAIIGFIVLSVIMLIIVNGLVFWKRRRNIRKNAMRTPAAMNFRRAQMSAENEGSGWQDQLVGAGPARYQGLNGDGGGGRGEGDQAIPLQSYGGDRPSNYR